MAAEQLVRSYDIAIGSHRVEVALPAAGASYAGHPVGARLDRGDGIATAQRSAQAVAVADHAGDELVGAALSEPHSAATLQLVDQRVARTGGHGLAANQERVERQRLAQLLVAHEARH